MQISTTHLERCLQTLTASLQKLQATEPDSIEFEIYRNAVIKGFELSLEVCGKLLRRALKAYGGSPKEVDELVYKEVLRRCAKQAILEPALTEQLWVYSTKRQSVADDDYIPFVQEILPLLPLFITEMSHIFTLLQQQETLSVL
jgi:hypothetical protein